MCLPFARYPRQRLKRHAFREALEDVDADAQIALDGSPGGVGDQLRAMAHETRLLRERRAPHDEDADKNGKTDDDGGETPECDSLMLVAHERVDQQCRAEQDEEQGVGAFVAVQLQRLAGELLPLHAPKAISNDNARTVEARTPSHRPPRTALDAGKRNSAAPRINATSAESTPIALYSPAANFSQGLARTG